MQRLDIKILFVSMFLSSTSFAKGLVVISGGYQSCPYDGEIVSLPHPPVILQIVDAAAPLIRAVAEKEHGVDIIWSCFSGVKIESNPYDSISHGPMTFLYSRLDGSHRLSPNRINYNSDEIDNGRPLERFFQFIEDQVVKTEPSGIYIAGHSFGGWTALQMGTRLAQKNIEIAGITLIDPISPFQCPANVMGTSMVLSGSTPSGCRMAPKDLLNQDMAELRNQSKWLVNFYQKKFSPLHSSALSYAGWENHLVSDFPYFLMFGDFHTYLSTAPAPWLLAANQVK